MNIEYKISCDNDELYKCLELWNEEVGYIFPIYKEAFDNNVINFKIRKVILAYFEGSVVGFAIIKELIDDFYTFFNDSLQLSLFYVSKKYRKNGIGNYLINEVKKEAKGRCIYVGREIGNFFPGIPSDFDNLTDSFMQRKGFVCGGYTHDMICHNPKNFEIKNKEVRYEFIDYAEKDDLIAFIDQNKWKRWAYEAINYFNAHKTNTGYLVGKIDGKIVSFAKINHPDEHEVSYNMMWKDRFPKLGSIGPLGVASEYRKKHLGYDIVASAINELNKLNVSDILIDWTGLLEFYQKFGFEVWKTYRYTNKEKDE